MNIFVRIGFYAATVVAALVYAASGYRIGVTAGESMAPSYHTGQVYLMRLVGREEPLRRGDVIVFSRGPQTCMKRILALPGDSFYVVARTGELQSDILLEETLLPKMKTLSRNPNFDFRIAERAVPKNSLYVLGDNAGVSEDSRYYGFVPRDAVIGKVIAHTPAPQDVSRIAWAHITPGT